VTDKVNNKHELFCREYVVDYNGTQAAIRAGYSKKTAHVQASALLRNPKVLTRVRELQKEQTERLAISQDWVIHQLVDVVEKCLTPVEVMEWDYEAKEMRGTGTFNFDSKGATKALELIGKHLGMYTDKMEVSTAGVTILNDIPDGYDESS